MFRPPILGPARTNIQGVMGGGSGPILAQLGHMEFLTSLNLDVSNEGSLRSIVVYLFGPEDNGEHRASCTCSAFTWS